MKISVNLFISLYKNIVNKIIYKIRCLDIFKRLIISFLILIIFTNTVVGLFSYHKFAVEMDNTISKYSYKTLYSLDTSITERFQKYTDVTFNLHRNEELKDLLKKAAALKDDPINDEYQQEEYNNLKKRIGQILYYVSSQTPGIDNIEIVSSYDEFIQMNYNNEPVGGRIADLKSFRNAEYYEKAVEAFNMPVWWDTSKENSVYMMYPYKSAYLGSYLTVLKAMPAADEGKTLGVIVINISLISLSDMFTYRELYSNSGDLLLLSKTGIIQYFSPTNYFIKLDSATLKDVIDLNTESIIRKISDEEYLISAIKCNSTDWTLCSVVPRSSLVSSIYAIRSLIIKIGLICIIVAFILSYLVTLSISQPMRKLKNTMEKVNENNIDIVYKDEIKDEIGILGQNFNSMINRIQNLINTVYEAELNKKEEMLRRKQAELDALQAQINPHFLYNTLDIIRWQIMAQENGESKASSMLSSFSDLLRLGTKRSSNLVQINEELEHIKAYIDVVRFDLEYELILKTNIDDNEILSCKIPKFTFQPLIENIIIHGFAHKKSLGEINISAFQNGDVVLIEITDNGEGISEDLVNSINTNLNNPNDSTCGIGLKNVNERLRLYFGEQYGLELMSKPGEYTKAVLRVPKIKN